MLLQIELLYFVLMIGSFIALLLWAKLPSGLCLMISAVIGAVVSMIFSQTPLDLRYFVEGTFGYFDTILVITTAMIFMGVMQVSGALEYLNVVLVKAFRTVPSALLVCFMLIIMFPAMVTGSSLASAISAGALVAPIMIKWGIPKAKTGAIIAMGAILGMVAPPVNVPAMVICEVVDIPYTGFTVPLMILAIPLAIVTVLMLGRKYVKAISKEDVEKVVDTSITKQVKWYVLLPLILLIVLIVLQNLLPKYFGPLGMSLMFVICAALGFFTGKRLPFFVVKKREEKKPAEEQGDEIAVPGTYSEQKNEEDDTPDSVVAVIKQGVYKSFSAMGLLMGVGMFMEIITLNGVRGYFTVNALSFPSFLMYVSMAIAVPVFGGISAFGSASILGGPYVMAFIASNQIYVTCGLSLLAALGEFMPPTAMSATFASKIVGEKSWTSVTKAALLAMAVVFVYALLYTIGFASWVQTTPSLATVLLAVMLGLSALTLIVLVAVELKTYFKNRNQLAVTATAAESDEGKED